MRCFAAIFAPLESTPRITMRGTRLSFRSFSCVASEWPNDHHDHDNNDQQCRHLVGDPIEALWPGVAVLQKVPPPLRHRTMESGQQDHRSEFDVPPTGGP